MRAISLAGDRPQPLAHLKTACILNDDEGADRYLKLDQTLQALPAGYAALVRGLASDALCQLQQGPQAEFVARPDSLRLAVHLQEAGLSVAQAAGAQPAATLALALFSRLVNDSEPALLGWKGRPLEALAASETTPDKQKFLHAGADFFANLNPPLADAASANFRAHLAAGQCTAQDMKDIVLATADSAKGAAALGLLMAGSMTLVDTWSPAKSDAWRAVLWDPDATPWNQDKSVTDLRERVESLELAP